MAVWSIVKFSELNRGIRIDADYYSPQFIKIESVLKSKKTIKKLNDFCVFIKKGIFDISPDKYKEKGVPLIRTQDIKNPLLNLSSAVFLDEDTHQNNYKTELTSGDLVFTKIGAYIGDVAYLSNEYSKYNFSQNVAGLKIKKDKISSEYLLLFLLSSFGVSQIKRIAMISGQGKLELEDVKNILIFEPEKKLQNLIKDYVLKAIEQKQKSQSLILYAELLLLSSLGLDKIEFPKGKWNVRMKSESESENRIDGEYFLPKYYFLIEKLKKNKIEILGNIVDYKKGYEVGSEAYEDIGKPFWRVSDVSKDEIGGTDTKFIDEKLYFEIKNKFESKKGEILFTKDATPGIAYYLRESLEGIISSGILRLKLKDLSINPEYLTLLLNSLPIKMQIEREGGGSVITHLRPERAMHLLIPIIDKKIQDKIAELTNEAHNARVEAKRLLEDAKHKVEDMILNG